MGGTGILPVLSRENWRDAGATQPAKSIWTDHYFRGAKDDSATVIVSAILSSAGWGLCRICKAAGTFLHATLPGAPSSASCQTAQHSSPQRLASRPVGPRPFLGTFGTPVAFMLPDGPTGRGSAPDALPPSLCIASALFPLSRLARNGFCVNERFRSSHFVVVSRSLAVDRSSQRLDCPARGRIHASGVLSTALRCLLGADGSCDDRLFGYVAGLLVGVGALPYR